MSSKNSSRVKLCPCGRTFVQSEKFGNETMCNACYKAHSEKFLDWFEAQPDAERREILDGIRAPARALGVTLAGQEEPAREEVDPEQESHGDQDAIDDAFNSIMKGFDL